jgi:hypothetical protein
VAEKKPAKKGTQQSAKSTGKPSEGFTAEERAAMRERAQELKAAARRGAAKADGESDLLAKIAEMPPADRAMAKQIHAIVTANAPDLLPKTWYGMPAYAKDGDVCFFQRRSSRPGARRSASPTVNPTTVPVADLLRAKKLTPPICEDRRACEEGGALKGRAAR